MSYLAQMPATWVVAHEVQRPPGLLNEIHRIISERGSDHKFALIGLGAGLARSAGSQLDSEGVRGLPRRSRITRWRVPCASGHAVC